MRRAVAWTVVLLTVGLGLLVSGASPAAAVDVGTPHPVINMTQEEFDRFMRQKTAGLRIPGGTASDALGSPSASNPTVRRVAGLRRAVSANAAAAAAGTPQVNVPSTTTKGPKFGIKKIAGGASTAVAAAYGVDLIYSGVQQGWFNGGLYGMESEGLTCDIGRLTGNPCSLALDPAYAPNTDVPPWTPGWMNGSNVVPLGRGSVQMTVNPTTQRATTAGTWSATCPVGQAGQWVVQSEVVSVQGANLVQGGSGGVVGVNCGFNGVPSYYPVPSWGGPMNGKPWAVVVSVNQDNPIYPTTYPNTPAGWAAMLAKAQTKGATAVWLSPDNPQRPADVDADPVRNWVTTWKCNGGPDQTLSSDPYRESDAEWPGPPQPVCTSGSLTYVKVEQMATGLPAALLYEWNLPDGASTWAETYPQCLDGSCVLELNRVDPATGTRLACFDQPEACVGWFESATKADEYVCTYGGVDLALSECNAYAPTFDRKNSTQDGAALGDPLTGENPAPPVPPTGTGTEDPSCPPKFEFTLGGMGFWVWKGVSCALSAAFVPAKPLETARVSTALNDSGLGQIGSGFSGVGAAFAGLSDGGCGVIFDTTVKSLGDHQLRVSTCDFPWNSMGALKTAFGVAFMCGAVLVGIRTVLRTIRVEPAGGGSEK